MSADSEKPGLEAKNNPNIDRTDAAAAKRIDPRVARTRELLRDALLILMEQKDYYHITVRDIADAAKVNRKTFYLHYETKDHLLQSVTDDILDELFGEAKDARSFGASIDELQRYIAGRIFEYVERYRVFFGIMFQRKAMSDFVQYMKRYFARFYEEKFAALDEEKLPAHKDVIASYIGSAYVGVIYWWLDNDMPYTPEEMTEQMIRLNSNGPIRLVRESRGEERGEP
ncbi:TetR/AcrR family transcriptional regulator C-terminal domain-containing protein [Saccharibacillus sp. CPCC 101409]|uniref:TetR/AcrR family transcriptional regulator n=1 Tax=Saccharibacillus sp. CPCC 101409 TaxID=3058041 RepID=UPI002672B211|nr:TetR/AcrR family transcriptional regulator [Saccharibacillus sp. CPCC 101409]MDO3412437.1 TetR/AcrR family transcriptional regulator C-terminal domain-containing protein [Saccharibacillus sp. CPCC 101409]